jgi:4-carboxymuconolactone decarboxylase
VNVAEKTTRKINMQQKEKSEAYQKGLVLFEELHGGHAGKQLVESLKDVCPDFADMTIEWAIGGIMSRPGLDLLTREYLLIASCTTLGHAELQLKAHIDAALKLGATKHQIVEVILQMLFYAGGASTSNALRAAQDVFQINDARTKN